MEPEILLFRAKAVTVRVSIEDVEIPVAVFLSVEAIIMRLFAICVMISSVQTVTLTRLAIQQNVRRTLRTIPLMIVNVSLAM